MSYIPPATAEKLANPAPAGERHGQAVKIACSLIGNGMSPEAVFAKLRSKYDDDFTDDELWKVLDWVAQLDLKPSTPRTSFRNSKTQRTARNDDTSPADAASNVVAFLDGFCCTEEEVLALSPVKAENTAASQAVTFLQRLYQPDELVNIVTEYTEVRSKSGTVKYNPKGYGRTMTAAQWIAEMQGGLLPTGEAGVWLRINPLNGRPPKRYPDSATIGTDDENVAVYRLALIEIDHLLVALQLPFLRRLPVPLVAIIMSGGKSDHGLVPINAATEAEYDKIVAELLKLLKPFGVDQSNKNPSRLSRLPGALRQLGGTGDGLQRLLYCDPDALKTPLDLRALREAVKPWHAKPTTSRMATADALQSAINDERPKIRLPGPRRLLSEFANELGALLADKDIFIRNGEVVRLLDGELCPVRAAEFRTLAEQYACFYKVRQVGENLIQFDITMTGDDAVGVLASPQFLRHLRQIRQVHNCRLPVLRSDGKMDLLPAGYDAETRTLTLPAMEYALDLPLADAVATINDLYSEFLFVDGERSRSVLVAGMLALYARHLLPANTDRVTFITTANAEGAGKGLVNSLMILPTMGAIYVGVKAQDEDEMRKALTTAIRESDPVVFLDNLKCHLNSPALEAFITADRWRDRLLGVNENVKGENLATVFITGNKLTVSPDIRRRALFIELLLEAERSDDRVIRRPLDRAKILAMRPTILAALWALVRHWDQQGRTKPSRSKGGFESWSEIIGGIVQAAGFGCPLETGSVALDSDPDTDDMRRLVEAMANLGTEYTFAGLVEVARKEECFMGIVGVDGEPKPPDTKARATLSRLLGSWDKRMIGKRRFSISGKGHARRYHVETVHGDTVKHGVSPDIGKNEFSSKDPNTVQHRATVHAAAAEVRPDGLLTDEDMSASVQSAAAPCAGCGCPTSDCDCWSLSKPDGES